jgi:hypothetical protein
VCVDDGGGEEEEEESDRWMERHIAKIQRRKRTSRVVFFK